MLVMCGTNPIVSEDKPLFLENVRVFISLEGCVQVALVMGRVNKIGDAFMDVYRLHDDMSGVIFHQAHLHEPG